MAVSGQSGTTEAVTFDVGYTLIEPSPPVGEVVAEVATAFGLTLTPAEAGSRFLEAWERTRTHHDGLVYGTNHEDALAYWRKVFSHMLQRPVGDTAVTGLVLNLYERFSGAGSWGLTPGWEETFAGLRRHGIKIGLVSNWDIRLRRILEGLGLLDQVDAVVISAECAMEKPAPGIFQRALDLLGLTHTPHTCLHLGDTWREDVLGAAGAGLRPAWFNPRGLPRPAAGPDCAEIRTLPELLSRV